MKTCVCIEGQLRGSKRCGPTMKKHLIDYLNADLYFYIQNYEKHNDENMNYYGESKIKNVYDNPSDFTETFDKICDEFGYDKNNWRNFFEQITDENYKLGFNKPGTCIRRMYNRYLIYNMLKDTDYDWYILTRSDLYFLDNFHDVSKFDSDSLHVYEKLGWNGLNNNFIVFHKNNFKKILTYLHNFLNNTLLNYIKNSNNLRRLNEERFFFYSMNAINIKVNTFKNMYYISGDDEREYTTWARIIKESNGDIHKYDDYFDALKNVQNK